MSLYKQGVILYIYIYIKKNQLSVYIPYIYTHTYIYVKQQDCVCGHCVCFAHTIASLWHTVGIELLFIRNWSSLKHNWVKSQGKIKWGFHQYGQFIWKPQHKGRRYALEMHCCYTNLGKGKKQYAEQQSMLLLISKSFSVPFPGLAAHKHVF